MQRRARAAAGTGRCNTGSSADLLVVGAYPNRMSWGLRRGDPSARDEVLANIAVVPLPDTDLSHGSGGPLNELWHAGQRDVARRPPTLPAHPHSAEIRLRRRQQRTPR